MTGQSQSRLATDTFSRPQSTHSRWCPVLSGDLAAQSLVTVQQIARDLRTLSLSPPATGPAASTRRDHSFASEAAGLAVFYAYLAEADLAEASDAADTAAGLLNTAIEVASNSPMTPALHGGFTGVAWALAHLEGRLLEADEDDEDAGAKPKKVFRA